MNNFTTHHLRSAESFDRMAEKARATGKKINGYTLAELEQHAAESRRIAALDQAGLLVHLEQSRAAMAARLAELRAR